MTERDIFLGAIELPTAEARAAYLRDACGRNDALRRQVEALLEEHFSDDSLLAGAAVAVGATATQHGEAGDPARMIGPYKLLEKIGEGGFGEVWMAEQREPVKRRVALKIIKPGMDSRQVVARFEAERQALAMMDHPNIAKILDAGTTEAPDAASALRGTVAPGLMDATAAGRPFFVMELVRGTRITEYCDQHQLTTRQRLDLFIQVCQAIQHAHQKGIIHRDIKPSNILVTVNDGAPVPKVIDFGIAKATQCELTDKTLFTQFQHFIGTPAYISPEQAEMSSLDIDTRADIYSLGVLLYEMLVGQTPFDAKEMMKGGLDALRKAIRETEPLRPSTRLSTMPGDARTTAGKRRQTDAGKLVHQLEGDLDWIVLKCLEKDRARRYATANGLAADLQRHLQNEPIVARPPSLAYRVGKLFRRQRLAFASAALVFLAAAAGIGGVMFVQYRANQDYRRRLYESEVNRAGQAWQAGQTDLMRTLLDRCPADLRRWEWTFLHQQADRWEHKILVTSTNNASLQVNADATVMVVATDGALQVRAVPFGQWLRNIPVANPARVRFTLAPRGDLVAVADGNLTLWNARTGAQVAEIDLPTTSWTWSDDGQRLAMAANGTEIRIWDATNGLSRPVHTTAAPVLALAFAPDRRVLAVGTQQRNIQLLDTATGAVLRTLQTQGPYFMLLTFSPDGRRLAAANGTAGGFARDHRVWNLDDEGASIDLNTGDDVSGFSFSADGRRLVIGDWAGRIRTWDLDRRVERESFAAHPGWVSSVRLLPDDRILSAGPGGVRLWLPTRPGVTTLQGQGNGLRQVAFSGDSRWLVCAGLAPQVMVWDAENSTQAGTYDGHADGLVTVAICHDGRIASAGHDLSIQLWDPQSFKPSWTTPRAVPAGPYWIVFSPDGRRLYAAARKDTLTVLDGDTGRILDSVSGLGDVLDGLAVSPDGRLLALCQKTRLSILRAEDLKEVWSVASNPDRCAAFSPDGKWLATGDSDGAISLWEMASAGRVRHRMSGHAGIAHGVAFHPDGTRLVSSGHDGRIKLWDWRNRTELLTLTTPGNVPLWHATFSPDGKTLAAAGGDGHFTLWRVE